MLKRVLLSLLICVPLSAGAEEWVTVFAKRGVVGEFEAKWVGGNDVTLRSPVPILAEGKQVRIWVRSSGKETVVLDGLSLIKGASPAGEVTPPFYPVSFAGNPGVDIPAKASVLCSDAVAAPITPGLWYLQQRYSSPKYLYAYDQDGVWIAAGPQEAAPLRHRTSFPGNVTRIDVLSDKATPVLVCYGDSITQGHSATPNAGKRYPQRLGELLGHPVLNLGMNGDLILHSRGVPKMLKEFDGVGEVVFLMGINDLLTRRITDLESYKKAIEPVLKSGVPIYLGTLLPASGHARFDDSPEKETLRAEINEWIRTCPAPVKAVIDFDAVVRDPDAPQKMKSEYQADWLHPSDAGYEVMAQEAARVIKQAREG